MAEATVYIVDDDVLVREGLLNLFESVELNAQAYESARDFLAVYVRDSIACLLLDVRLQEMGGFELQQALAERKHKIPIIFMTGFGTIPMSVRAIKAGASEFLTKPIDGDAMLLAVHSALAESHACLQDSDQDAQWQHRYDSLTPREREVLALVIGGLMNKQVAAELGTSDVTAKVHKRRVMEKMGARSLADLVRMASKLNIEAARTR